MKRMRWFNEEDGALDVLVKIVTISGVLIGTWVYFDTIHPVFEKERALLDAKSETQRLKKEIDVQHRVLTKNAHDIATQRERIETQRRQMSDLARRAGATELEALRLRTQIRAEQNRADQRETAAIESHIERYRDAIVHEGINQHILHAFDGKVATFPAREYTLHFVQEQRKNLRDRADDEATRVQLVALDILEQFARDKMTSGGNEDEIFGVTVFYLEMRLQKAGF